MERDDETLIEAAMQPSYERLVWLHRLLDPPGTSLSLLSVEQLVERLRSDLEHREAALGRALSLLRRCWNGGARLPVFDHMVEEGAEKPVSWPDVLRWVSDEPNDHEEETVDDQTPKVMETARPDERAAAGVDESAARWRGFSDAELRALRQMSSQRSTSAELDQERRRINVGVQEEQRRREAERSSYRGPGRYRHRGGYVYEVLGRAPTPRGEQVVLRRPGDDSGRLMTDTLTAFEDGGPEGRRRYEYLGPLEGSSS